MDQIFYKLFATLAILAALSLTSFVSAFLFNAKAVKITGYTTIAILWILLATIVVATFIKIWTEPIF